MAAKPKHVENSEKLKDSAPAGGIARQACSATRLGADRRTELAADRTVFAAERTYAAWVHTGVVAMASGVGARPLLEASCRLG